MLCVVQDDRGDELGLQLQHGVAEAPRRWWCLEVDGGGSLAWGSPGVPQYTKAMDSDVR